MAHDIGRGFSRTKAGSTLNAPSQRNCQAETRKTSKGLTSAEQTEKTGTVALTHQLLGAISEIRAVIRSANSESLRVARRFLLGGLQEAAGICLSGNEKCRADDTPFGGDVIAVRARDLLEQSMSPQEPELAGDVGTLAPGRRGTVGDRGCGAR